ncbi:DEAD/DEAH box helicase, partial [Pseudoalteromonas phenolica]|uniref:DEAD/DEAH box helicase n=1 Tax=Pseudoalteromonas phenolica TaxID=161398 RepID=UPI00110BC4EA
APEVVAGLAANGFENCTPIQEKCVPFVCDGPDIAGQEQTGTAKTLAFLPATCPRLMQTERRSRKHPRPLIMAPTTERAIQIQKDPKIIAPHGGLTVGVGDGGVEFDGPR